MYKLVSTYYSNVLKFFFYSGLFYFRDHTHIQMAAINDVTI